MAARYVSMSLVGLPVREDDPKRDIQTCWLASRQLADPHFLLAKIVLKRIKKKIKFIYNGFLRITNVSKKPSFEDTNVFLWEFKCLFRILEDSPTVRLPCLFLPLAEETPRRSRTCILRTRRRSFQRASRTNGFLGLHFADPFRALFLPLPLFPPFIRSLPHTAAGYNQPPTHLRNRGGSR